MYIRKCTWSNLEKKLAHEKIKIGIFLPALLLDSGSALSVAGSAFLFLRLRFDRTLLL